MARRRCDVIGSYQADEFSNRTRPWRAMVTRMGGMHHGYFLPNEGARNIAVAPFGVPSLAG